jgi:hypothetical protein
MTMHKRLLPVLALILCAIFAAPAQANFKVGIADQNASMFDNANFQALKVKRIRYLIPWDWYKHPGQKAEVDGFLNYADAHNADVLAHFTARRGCYEDGRYSKRKVCKAPSVRKYKYAFKRLRREHSFIRTIGIWNEGNHSSQPVYRKPRRAAKYFLAGRKLCRSCKLVAADLLDTRNMTSWFKKFKRHAKGKARIWGLHNYGDVNRKRSSGTRALLRVASGEVWLTETGGILQMSGQFKRSERRQARATKYMFKLVSRYDSRRRGMKGRVTRLYNYQFTGAPRSARFDAGLVDEDGSPRRAYKQFKKSARRFAR